MSDKRRILICPLDWGLGHASRLIPIINALLKTNRFEIILAADNYPFHLLRSEFPNLQWIQFPSTYKITYTNRFPLLLKMLLISPRIIWGILKENRQLKMIVKAHQIDIVLSDNRFGLWHTNTLSIFMTHQVMIKMPKGFGFMEYPVHLVNKFIINRYHQCWIPDNATEPFIAGDLAHQYPLPANAKYIGLISRFSLPHKEYDKRYDILVILSGPEPQRSVFEELIISQLKDTSYKTLVVGGKPGDVNKSPYPENVTYRSHLSAQELQEAILSSEIVISRSGYTTIMDLIKLQKSAILIPTPGQTEQEYLANYYREKKIFHTIPQKDFDLVQAVEESKGYSSGAVALQGNLLDEAIEQL